MLIYFNTFIQVKESGVECRPAKNCCDLPEYCNGADEMCPEDEFVYDGFPCKAYGVRVFRT